MNDFDDKLIFYKEDRTSQKMINVRLNHEDHDRITAITKETGMSIQGVVKKLILFALERSEIKEV